MSVTQTDLDHFDAYARANLYTEGVETISDLFDRYLLEYPSPEEQAEVRAAIERGLADIRAGRVRPVEEVLAELRQKYGVNDQ